MATDPNFARAVSDNAVSAVRRFLRRGEPPSDDATFLAVRHKANAVLRLLIEAGANLNAVEHPKAGGYTLLTRAIIAKNEEGFRPLTLASSPSIVQLLKSERYKPTKARGVPAK